MNIALWILQGLLAVSMLASGGMKLAKSKAKLVSDFKMAWATDFSEAQIMELGAFIAFHYGVQMFMRSLGATAPQGAR